MASTEVHPVRTDVSRDSQGVVAGDPALLASGTCCSSRLQGRHPHMSREQFLATWARNGAFCTVANAGGTASLTVGLSLVRPVPLQGLEQLKALYWVDLGFRMPL